jgi:hypothetical protein
VLRAEPHKNSGTPRSGLGQRLDVLFDERSHSGLNVFERFAGSFFLRNLCDRRPARYLAIEVNGELLDVLLENLFVRRFRQFVLPQQFGPVLRLRRHSRPLRS